MKDKFRGSLVGLAVCDALGSYNEFKRWGTFVPITDMMEGGPWQLKRGQWTDDTSMALCLAESLIYRRHWDARDQMRRYVKWWRKGYNSSTGRCFDIGNATRESLASFQRTGLAYSGSTDPSKAGNGSLMRLTPVVLRYANESTENLSKYAILSSDTTHGCMECVESCQLMAQLIRSLLKGLPKEKALQYMALNQGYSCKPVQAIANREYTDKEPPRIWGQGRASGALEAALWAFERTEDFEDGALMAVNLGFDADTVGAIYGQIAGAHYGHLAIPLHWRLAVSWHDRLCLYADLLYQRAQYGT